MRRKGKGSDKGEGKGSDTGEVTDLYRDRNSHPWLATKVTASSM